MRRMPDGGAFGVFCRSDVFRVGACRGMRSRPCGGASCRARSADAGEGHGREEHAGRVRANGRHDLASGLQAGLLDPRAGRGAGQAMRFGGPPDDGLPLTGSVERRRWYRALDRVGLNHEYVPHSARHTTATILN